MRVYTAYTATVIFMLVNAVSTFTWHYTCTVMYMIVMVTI